MRIARAPRLIERIGYDPSLFRDLAGFPAEPFPLFRLRLFGWWRRRFLFFGRWFFLLRSGFLLFCAWLGLFSFRLLFVRGFFLGYLCRIVPFDQRLRSLVA